MLHYTIYKNNDTSLPWLTFIHGAGGSSSIWHKQIRFFSNSAKKPKSAIFVILHG